MENLEYFIATLRALAQDYHVTNVSCRVSGTTIYLVIDTQQARPGAPSLGYLRARLQVLDPNYRAADLQAYLQPRAVPLPPPVGSMPVRPVPIFPPGMFSVPPPPLPPGPSARLPAAPLARPPLAFLRADWNVPLPPYPVVPFMPPLGLSAPMPPLGVTVEHPLTSSAPVSTSTSPYLQVTSPLGVPSTEHLSAMARLAARVPVATTTTPARSSQDLARSPEIRAILEKRPRPSILAPPEAARASDHAPVTHIGPPPGILGKFDITPIITNATSTATAISPPATTTPPITGQSTSSLALSSPPVTIYAALHAPSVPVDPPTPIPGRSSSPTPTCSFTIVLSAPGVFVSPTTSWSSTYGGRARRYRSSSSRGRLPRTPVSSSLPRDAAAAVEDRPTRALPPVVSPVGPPPTASTAPSTDTRDVFMGHPDDCMGE